MGRGRVVVAAWCVLGLAAAGLVVAAGTGYQAPLSGLRKAGHWVFDTAAGAAFHIDGPTKNLDAKIGGFPGANHLPGFTIQGSSKGYVVHGRTIDVFDTPTLSVNTSIPMTVDEQPVGLEVNGGPYLVYRATGTAVRLDVPPLVIQLGGPVADPVATEDGTVWLRRTDSGALCHIAPGASGIACAGNVPDGHTGALAVISGHASFVDATDATVRPVGPDGLGPAKALGVAVPAGATLGNADVDGRLPIVDKGRPQLLLADVTSGGAPVAVPLAAGDYGQVAVGEGTVAVVNATTGEVLTFDAKGNPKAKLPVPGGAKGVQITKGQDQRLYVDTANGTHTLVVDHDGSVTAVPIGGSQLPQANPTPSTPAAPPATQPATTKTAPPPTTTKKAAPGAPGAVNARPGNGQAQLSWGAAAANGDAVQAYTVAWRGDDGSTGTADVPGNRLTTDLTGLRNGVTYTATVTARNGVGTGPAATSAPFKPSSEVPGAPGGVRASAAAADGSVAVSWDAANGQGHTITRYDVTATGSDGSTAPAGTATGTTATVNGLTLGVTYQFTVTATNDLGTTGPASAAGGGATPFKAAAAPGGVKAAVRDGGATLSWNAPNLNGGTLDHYVVTATGRPDQDVTAGPVSFDGLANGTAYTFTVKAVTKGKEGGGTRDGATGTAAGTPGRTATADVTGVSLSGDRQATVNLNVNLYNSGAGTCQLVFNGALRWSGGCAGSVVVGGLSYSTTYDVYAQVVNAYGTGPAGAHGSVRTNDAPPPATISVSKGGRYSGSACTSSSCAYLTVTLANFAANTKYSVICTSGGPAGGSGDYYQYDVTTNGSGASTSSTCFYGYPGQQVWAHVVSGPTSNTLTW
ncbi:fibronectin type III domain-containing protein [Dactylosporangium sp. CS-033363]|uniref:fibronectin type III domain-containing protein n=1 Tax=Dactylosporangium sp. CS-033363 TaxID=3239935 RepID=UPI003D93F777